MFGVFMVLFPKQLRSPMPRSSASKTRTLGTFCKDALEAWPQIWAKWMEARMRQIAEVFMTLLIENKCFPLYPDFFVRGVFLGLGSPTPVTVHDSINKVTISNMCDTKHYMNAIYYWLSSVIEENLKPNINRRYHTRSKIHYIEIPSV